MPGLISVIFKAMTMVRAIAVATPMPGAGESESFLVAAVV